MLKQQRNLLLLSISQFCSQSHTGANWCVTVQSFSDVWWCWIGHISYLILHHYPSKAMSAISTRCLTRDCQLVHWHRPLRQVLVSNKQLYPSVLLGRQLSPWQTVSSSRGYRLLQQSLCRLQQGTAGKRTENNSLPAYYAIADKLGN